MNKYGLHQHMAFIRWRNGYELQRRLPRAHSYSLRSLEFHSHFGAESVKTICQWSLDTPKETFKGKCDSISRRVQLHKRRGVAEPQLFWFMSRLSQSSVLCYLKRMVQTQSHQEHSYFHNPLHLNGNDKEKKPRGKRRQCGLTRVRPEVSCEGVPPSAGIAAEGTFERFLPRVQLDVPQQVPLLGKRSSTLVTVEGAFTWKGNGREPSRNTGRCTEPVISLFLTVPSGMVPTTTITQHLLKSEAVSFAQRAKPPA